MAGTSKDAPRTRWKSIAFYAVIVIVNLLALEVFLRLVDLRELRIFPEAARQPVEHDAELGWAPVPNKVQSADIRINSIGLRDVELEPAGKPTVAFVGDSFVFGLGVKAEQRFTDLLRRDLPEMRVVNVGVAGYGTDQELLLLKRLWPKLEPRVVVLIVCVDNDHEDNSRNARHGRHFKPYLVKAGDTWRFEGLPVPRGPRWYYEHDWLVGHVTVVRAALYLYMLVRHPSFTVPDPTGPLVAMMRDHVQSQGAKFLVGLQKRDPGLEPFLKSSGIPYVTLEDAPQIGGGDNHWSPEGHAIVARRLKAFMSAEGALAARP
jgi:hypothetical protein